MRGRRRGKRVILFVVQRDRKVESSDGIIENASVAVLNGTSDISGEKRREDTRREIARLFRDEREVKNDRGESVTKDTIGRGDSRRKVMTD
jgi:hypothetical protein